jgi:hypothetical protein
MRNILLEYDMEVGSAKTEGAHSCASHSLGSLGPGSKFGIDVKGGVGKVNIGIGVIAV